MAEIERERQEFEARFAKQQKHIFGEVVHLLVLNWYFSPTSSFEPSTTGTSVLCKSLINVRSCCTLLT